jgi:hypothetical protein
LTTIGTAFVIHSRPGFFVSDALFASLMGGGAIAQLCARERGVHDHHLPPALAQERAESTEVGLDTFV